VGRRIDTNSTDDDVVGFLIAASFDGRRLTMGEVKRILMMLYSAGLHTTMNTLANAVGYLATDHDVRDRLTAEPNRIPDAVEELMRHESIVSVRRTPVVDVEIGGVAIPAGEPMMLFLGSAGRDEDVFADPDRVDIDRVDRRHLGFGVGPHRCLGSHLARMELRLALEELHRHAPAYRLDPSHPVVRHTGVERGIDALWLLA
jgi:cytochrome P450